MQRVLSSGVTLLELMILILIAGIAVAGATYSFGASTQNQLADQIANNLDSALRFARSQAVARGTTVSVCSASNSSLNACSTDASAWNNGWIVFEDSNQDGAIASTSDILQVFPIIGRNTGITTTRNVTFSGIAIYLSTGIPLGNNRVYLIIRPAGCRGNTGREVLTTQSGRVIVRKVSCP